MLPLPARTRSAAAEGTSPEATAAHAAAHLVADEKDAEIQRLKTQVQELSEKLASAEEALEDANEEAGSAEARSGEAQAEIVRLKAKLYDYMTAGA